MLPYFEDPITFANLYRICKEWHGTPFRHMSLVKGAGADCSTFIGGMFVELGIIKEVKFDFYPSDWYLSNPSLLVDSVEKHLREKLVDGLSVIEIDKKSPLMRGDIIAVWTYKEGIASHAALILENQDVIHCRWGNGVEIRPYALGWFEKRLEKVYRVMRSI